MLARFVATLVSAVGLVTIAWPAEPPETTRGDLPKFEAIKKLVDEHFASDKEYRPKDLITRDQVAAVLDKLHKLGWRVRQRDAILADVPAQDEFLPKELRTRQGLKFMRQISSYPLAYDRLDRFSQMPQGKQTLRDLIRGPDGYKLIEYMAESKGGKALGKQLANSKAGTDFNKPTGKIYTQDQLLSRLERAYEEDTKAPVKQPQR
jgi:hypothetical protein